MFTLRGVYVCVMCINMYMLYVIVYRRRMSICKYIQYMVYMVYNSVYYCDTSI
jgi:hypothetical protein